MIRECYERDAPIIKENITGLKGLKKDDLIKKAGIRWFDDQFNRITVFTGSLHSGKNLNTPKLLL